MLTIRHARVEDAAALAFLAERIVRDAFTDDSDASDMELHCAENFGRDIQLREIEDPSLVTLVGEFGGEPIAFAQVRLSSAVECVSARSRQNCSGFTSCLDGMDGGSPKR